MNRCYHFLRCVSISASSYPPSALAKQAPQYYSAKRRSTQLGGFEMNIRKLFRLDSIEHILREEGKAAALKAAREFGTVRPMMLSEKCDIDHNYAIAETTAFIGRLPLNDDTRGLIDSLEREEDIWLSESIVRSNQDLVEFHKLDNPCRECGRKLTSCTCRDHIRLHTSSLCTEIPCALKRLWFGGELAIVNQFTNSLFEILNIRDQSANECFPPNDVGVGFDHYVRGYHIRGPET